MGVSPQVADTPSLLVTEVSLSPYICHRLPRSAIPDLPHLCYRSLLKEGHCARGGTLAQDFNPDMGERT